MSKHLAWCPRDRVSTLPVAMQWHAIAKHGRHPPAIASLNLVFSPGFSVADMTDWMAWYNALEKPDWTPPGSTISIIWQILYPIMAVSFGFVLAQLIRRKIPWWVGLPFAINLLANLLFFPIQFYLRDLPLAAVDIVVVWTTIVWMMLVIWKHYKWVAVAQVPYLVWISIATVLQLSITWNNRAT